ncbi:hypothetical protein BDW69DRAFT_110793 [Aspergillus filifer]
MRGMVGCRSGQHSHTWRAQDQQMDPGNRFGHWPTPRWSPSRTSRSGQVEADRRAMSSMAKAVRSPSSIALWTFASYFSGVSTLDWLPEKKILCSCDYLIIFYSYSSYILFVNSQSIQLNLTQTLVLSGAKTHLPPLGCHHKSALTRPGSRTTLA